MQYHITVIIALRIHNILFKTFVNNIYLSNIWIPNRYCMAKLNIAYNNAYRIVMNCRRRNSVSLMFFNDYNLVTL